MKDIKIGDICYVIQHSVYGKVNEPVNEPSVLEVSVTSIDGDIYRGRGTDTLGIYTVPEKLIYKTSKEAREYIKEHRMEIIKESFENHKKWFEEMKRKARQPY